MLHISSNNVKVYAAAQHAARSFIFSPGFKTIYAPDGRQVGVSELRAGTLVRVFYSYTFGIRHANAVFIIHSDAR